MLENQCKHTLYTAFFSYIQRIFIWPGDDKVVVHDFSTLDPKTLGYEFFLRGPVVYEYQVCVARLAQFQRSTRSHRYHPHVNAGAVSESRDQVIQQPGIFY